MFLCHNQCKELGIPNSQPHRVLSVRQLSESLNWEVGEEIAILVGSVNRRRCFIFHRENIQLLRINIWFLLPSQHKHRQNEGDSSSSDWLGLRPYRHVRTRTTTCRITLLYFFFRMDSSIKCFTRVYLSLSVTRHGVTHHAAFQPGGFTWWMDSNMPTCNTTILL
jgi:hypothetical protein